MSFFGFYGLRAGEGCADGGAFEAMIERGEVDEARNRMSYRIDRAVEGMREYNTATHEIMKRPRKIVNDMEGNFVRAEDVARLPIAYQAYINEIPVVFLYGRPVKWTQASEETDEAFAAFQDVIRRTRFDSKIRQCKRLAGIETESAMLFRVYRNEEGKADVQIRVLARSKGDEIYVRRDQYENLLSVAWGYFAKDDNDESIYHIDFYTKRSVYRCERGKSGWEVRKEANLVGKIPIILFQQEKEWAGVEPLIEREEYVASRRADVNDYFADPVLVMSADAVVNTPQKKDDAKMIITNDPSADGAVKYLTWDNASQSKQSELDWLRSHILSKSFTPDITLDTLRSMSSMSGKALRTVMMLADIKAARHKETHDELLDRTASLITAIIGNVLDVSLHSQCERMKVAHEFQEPFGEDIKEDLENIIRASDSGLLSKESAVEMNPLVKDHTMEKDRISREEESRREIEMDAEEGSERDRFDNEEEEIEN